MPTPTLDPHPTRAPIRVLLVHDEPYLVTAWTRLLHRAGFDVVSTDTRGGAVMALRMRIVDVLVFDWESEDGPALLHDVYALRENERIDVARVVLADAPRRAEHWVERLSDDAVLVTAIRRALAAQLEE